MIFWDFLVWILIIFPLATGGLWIQRPGLKLEHTELAVPVLIVTALGYFLVKKRNLDLSQASSVRLAKKLWQLWNSLLQKAPRKALIGAALFMAMVLSAASIRRHWAFGSGAYDLGIFTNGLWNLGHGNGYFSSVRGGINLLTDHQSFIVWLISPLFNYFGSPEFLLILQAVGISLGGISTYFLARQYLGSKSWATAALPLLYWSYFPVRNANAFDFHPETLMLPFLLFAITGIQSSRIGTRVFGFVALILGLMAKETAPAVVTGIAIGWILGAGPVRTQNFTKRVGVILVPLATTLFFLELKWVPHLIGGEHYHLHAHLSQYGGSLTDLFFAPILKPGVFWGNLLGPSRLKFLFYTLAPLAFLPIFAWRNLIAALPGYILLFLTEGDHKVSIQYHYAIEPAVGLFWAFPAAIQMASHPLFSGRAPKLLKTFALPGVVLFFALTFFGRSEFYRIRKNAPTAHQEWIRKSLIPCLSEVPLAGSTALIPHVSTRAWAREIGVLVQSSGAPVNCVFFDYNLNNWSMGGAPWDGFLATLKTSGYQSAFQCGGTALYELSSAPGSCLRCQPDCTP